MASHRGIVVRALTWNLFHGRDDPPERSLLTWRSRLLGDTERGVTYAQVNAPLLREFAALLAGWDWQVALLQEAPPRWLAPLGNHCRASGVSALTSRNLLAAVRAAAAQWNPDLIASNEGGSNIVLVRSPARIVEVQRVVLARRPERRRLLLARVQTHDGRRLVVANTHLSVPSTGSAHAEALRGAEHALRFARDEPLIFGGDLNLRPAREPAAFEDLHERYCLASPTAPGSIDHLLARQLDVLAAPRALPAEEREVRQPGGLRLRLSDHAPVVGTFGVR
ncbi:MAG TPA: endonuclease/exonuclease/phosphatase family protein [Thermoleophilaceae bacterium]|nr:endonuclease/exonuclease/phosphatase family protein [Thermoleophilaceae bacterium]